MAEALDATDRRILAVLQKEGRISNADLAQRVNLSASAALTCPTVSSGRPAPPISHSARATSPRVCLA